ncbi:MAG: aldolase, partial [Deltaproteobacteria bacterium CG07_land_8_20_14_0_80_38_7]
MESWNSIEELKNTCVSVFDIKDDELVILDERRFRNDTINKLIWNAVFSSDETTKKTSQRVIWNASQQLGCPSASIHDFYIARAYDKWEGMTIPAINL